MKMIELHRFAYVQTANLPELMKNIVFIAFCTIWAVSCNGKGGEENNPQVQDLPECAFTLKADETRDTDPTVFRWTISRNGRTDSVDEAIDDMYVTRYNTLTLIVEPSETGFQGVNVRSTNTGAVRVTQVDQKHYLLSYQADGKATIEVWNGNGSNKTAFKVNAKEIIYIERVIWEIDGKEHPLKYVFKSQEEQINMEHKLIHPEEYNLTVEDYDWDRLKKDECFVSVEVDEAIKGVVHHMSFLRVEPENTSYRIVEFEATRFYKDYWIQRANEWFGYTWKWENYSGPIHELDSDAYFAVDDQNWFNIYPPVGGDGHVNYFFKMAFRLHDGPSMYSNFYSYSNGFFH